MQGLIQATKNPTQNLLVTLNTDFQAGIQQLSSALKTLTPDDAPPSPESAGMIRRVITAIAYTMSPEKDHRTFEKAKSALTKMATHPTLLGYYDDIIQNSAEQISDGKGSESIDYAQILNNLARSVESTHIFMLNAQTLPITLEAFRTQFQSYHGLSNSTPPHEDTPALYDARTRLLQYGVLLFKLLKSTSPTTEKLKIKVRDEIQEMLQRDHDGTGEFCPRPSHPLYQPLDSFLGSIQPTSSDDIRRHAFTSPFATESARSSHSTATPQTALTLFTEDLSASASSIERSDSAHTLTSHSRP